MAVEVATEEVTMTEEVVSKVTHQGMIIVQKVVTKVKITTATTTADSRNVEDQQEEITQEEEVEHHAEDHQEEVLVEEGGNQEDLDVLLTNSNKWHNEPPACHMTIM